VFSTDQTGVRSRASRWLAWGEAQDEWSRLDDLRRAGELPEVKFLSVRSADDPQWNMTPYEPWAVLTSSQRPKAVSLDRAERARLLDIGRAAGGLQDAHDAMFSELVSDGRWAHLPAVDISDYTWAAARFCFPQEAKWL
jgi:hypothetical protein